MKQPTSWNEANSLQLTPFHLDLSTLPSSEKASLSRLLLSFQSKTQTNRLGTPEDIAPVITFVASPAAQWLNGQNILTNGVTVFLTFEVFELPTDLYFI